MKSLCVCVCGGIQWAHVGEIGGDGLKATLVNHTSSLATTPSCSSRSIPPNYLTEALMRKNCRSFFVAGTAKLRMAVCFSRVVILVLFTVFQCKKGICPGWWLAQPHLGRWVLPSHPPSGPWTCWRPLTSSRRTKTNHRPWSILSIVLWKVLAALIGSG